MRTFEDHVGRREVLRAVHRGVEALAFVLVPGAVEPVEEGHVRGVVDERERRVVRLSRMPCTCIHERLVQIRRGPESVIRAERGMSISLESIMAGKSVSYICSNRAAMPRVPSCLAIGLA